MATKTFYLTDGTASNSNHHSLQEGGSPPADSVLTTGWVVNQTTPTVYARMDSGTERTAASQGATAQPDGAPDNTLGDCFRSASTINGTFANANWSLSFQVEGITRATSPHDGLIRVRIWRSANEDGSSAVELTGSTLSSTQYTNLTNSTAQTLTITWSPGATKVLTNEYLFIQVAHQLDGAGTHNAADTHLCLGSNNFITTSDFTPGSTNWTTTITDTVQIADTISKVSNKVKVISNTIQVSDTIVKTINKVILLTDTENISDVILASLLKTFTISDSISISDTISNVRQLYKLIANAINISDVSTNIRNINKLITNTTNISDILTNSRNINKLLSNTTNASDTLTNARNINKLITDTINSSDTIITARILNRTLSDGINVSDVILATTSGEIVWQYSYPIADVTSGIWTNELDSYVNIYTSIDEEVANDDDYIQSPVAPDNSSYETLLSGLGTPQTKTNHTLYYRYSATISGVSTLVAKLMQGDTEIAQWTHSGIGTDWVTVEQSLTQDQMDTITDYTDLRVIFIANI